MKALIINAFRNPKSTFRNLFITFKIKIFMARLKFNSVVLQELRKRINGLKAIKPDLILKNGLSVATSEKVERNLTTLQNDYNILLTLLDRKRHELLAEEKIAQLHSKNLFIGVKNDFGDDSLEYESVGGTRISMRQRKSVKTHPIT
jgi:hypothetical protein